MGLEQPGDLSEFRRHPGGDDHEGGPPVHDGGPPKHHVVALGHETSVLGGDHFRGLVHRNRFTGQRRLVEAQIGTLDQAAVRRDDVTSLEHHDITDNHIGRRDRRLPAIPNRLGHR